MQESGGRISWNLQVEVGVVRSLFSFIPMELDFVHQILTMGGASILRSCLGSETVFLNKTNDGEVNLLSKTLSKLHLVTSDYLSHTNYRQDGLASTSLRRLPNGSS